MRTPSIGILLFFYTLATRTVYRINRHLWNNIAVAVLLTLAKYYDIIFIQKVLLSKHVLNKLHSINSNIIMDFDDAIYVQEYEKEKGNFDYTLKHSKLVIIENKYNQDYVKQFHIPTLILTGPIDCLLYRPLGEKISSDVTVIGWVGSPSTSKYLKMIERPLQIVSKHYKVVLEIIGDTSIKIPGVTTRCYSWSLATEVELLQRFDIGIMPLPNDEWTKGKGGYKILQYMAIGIPSIASPVGVNSDIIQQGVTGFLADTEKEWVIALETLIQDKAIRRQMGAAARKSAENNYSYESSTPALVQALQEILI